MAREYTQFSDQLNAQAQTLSNLTEAPEGWVSDAGRQFASSARDLGDQLLRAHRNYAEVGRALAGYAHDLFAAQQQADSALSEAKTAAASTSSHSGSTSGVSEATSVAASGPVWTGFAPSWGPAAGSLMAQQSAALQPALARLNGALADRDQAARRAATRIRHATQHGGLSDNWWSNATHAIHTWAHDHRDFFEKVASVAGWIATGLAVAAMAVTVAAIFLAVPELAVPLLLYLAGGATLTALASHVTLLAGGDGSWQEVGFDLVAIGTLTYGGVATHLAEGVEEEMTARVANQVGDDAEKEPAASAHLTGEAPTAGEALSPADRAAALRATSAPVEDANVPRDVAQEAIQREAAQAIHEAGTRASMNYPEALATTRPSMMRTVAYLDGEKAAQATHVQQLMADARDDPKVQEAGQRVLRYLHTSNAANWGSVISDATDKTHALEHLEEQFDVAVRAYRHASL